MVFIERIINEKNKNAIERFKQPFCSNLDKVRENCLKFGNFVSTSSYWLYLNLNLLRFIHKGLFYFQEQLIIKPSVELTELMNVNFFVKLIKKLNRKINKY